MLAKSLILFACIAITLAYPINNIEIVSDFNGQVYYLVPVVQSNQQSLQRQRRQVTSGDVNNTGFKLSHTQPLINNDRHQLDLSGNVEKQFGGPYSAGGALDYMHKPSSSSASLYSQHTQGLGTDAGAKVQYNFHQSRNGHSTAGISGNYDQHFGGARGNTKPEFGVFLNYKLDF